MLQCKTVVDIREMVQTTYSRIWFYRGKAFLALDNHTRYAGDRENLIEIIDEIKTKKILRMMNFFE